ncbi:uncharacterized protein LOC141599350 [Silene latifolia]|uniref:uncharacterized protein LOC141599350 n=1 Tax=Silene latifolia TaxID=37657 RepID=UPI003D76B085
MEASFQKRESKFTANLRNNHDTYLAASDDGRSLNLVSHIGAGSIPKSTEWTVKLSSGTSKFTEFNLRSVYGKELAAQKTENGEIVVYQKNPGSDRPFCWRVDNSQLPLTGGVYLSCDCDSQDWISDFHKLCATQDGTITTKPSFDDTLEDPGAWWFIEVVEKSASEQQQGNLIPPIHYQESTSYKWRAPDYSQQFVAGKNSNGSGNQNIGDVKIENKFSVTEAGYATLSPSSSSKAPTISTIINAGNNSNGSGTQTNNVTIKNEVPIYRHR